MKITQQTQKIIRNAVDMASVLGIENIALDAFSLRGENKDIGVAIIMPTTDLTLEFDALGLSRIPELKNRLNMMTSADIQFELAPNTSDKIVSSLKMSQGRTKVAYKCQNPSFIRAPKAINDPNAYEMVLSDDDVQLIIKSISMMGSQNLTFCVQKDSAAVKISDPEGDILSHDLDTNVVVKDSNIADLSKSYNAKTFKTIFLNYIKKDDGDTLPIAITRRGILKLSVLNMTIYLFPER